VGSLDSPSQRLTRAEVCALLALALGFVGYAPVVEFRSVFLSRPMTDVQVYFRAAWAARVGEDIYTVTDDNHWHYHYPALLALVAMPLADAPAGVERSGLLPYAVSVGLWYGLSVAFLLAGVHTLASALEPDAVRGSSRWYALRFWSIVACLPAIAATLMRGQVNLMLLAVLCAAGAALVRGRSWRAGLWIATAVCLKVIPAFLLIYPVWRRDYRCLGGCVLGLVAGLVLIPAAWFGPARTADYFVEWYNVLARPGLGTGDDHTRDKELIGATSTDSQSIGPIIHNTIYHNSLLRPQQHSAAVRLAHWSIGGLMTLLTLLAGGGSDGHRLRPLLLLGTLVLLMLLLSPICHLHYFCLALPLITGLIAMQWEATGSHRQFQWGLASLLIVNFVANGVTHLPESELVRDLGVATYATALLWLWAVVTLWRTRSRPVLQGRLLPAPPPVSVNVGTPLQKAG
jgi:hypothetical protein